MERRSALESDLAKRLGSCWGCVLTQVSGVDRGDDAKCVLRSFHAADETDVVLPDWQDCKSLPQTPQNAVQAIHSPSSVPSTVF